MKRTIKEVKEKLLLITDPEDAFIAECLLDERKGVQLALKQWTKKQEAHQALIDRYQRMSKYENHAKENGYQSLAGIDEVGRGPLAGPVVSAAVILDETKPILGLDDSKKLSLKKRNELFIEIKEKAVAVGIGLVDSGEIDRYNILEATKIAMHQASKALDVPADFLLVDAVELNNGIPTHAITKGDLKSNSIAAASIIAKVTRDQLMVDYDEEYPGYGFKNNVGYGTKEHLEGLKKQGATPIHRRSFSPVRKYLF